MQAMDDNSPKDRLSRCKLWMIQLPKGRGFEEHWIKLDCF